MRALLPRTRPRTWRPAGIQPSNITPGPLTPSLLVRQRWGDCRQTPHRLERLEHALGATCRPDVQWSCQPEGGASAACSPNPRTPVTLPRVAHSRVADVCCQHAAGGAQWMGVLASASVGPDEVDDGVLMANDSSTDGSPARSSSTAQQPGQRTRGQKGQPHKQQAAGQGKSSSHPPLCAAIPPAMARSTDGAHSAVPGRSHRPTESSPGDLTVRLCVWYSSCRRVCLNWTPGPARGPTQTTRTPSLHQLKELMECTLHTVANTVHREHHRFGATTRACM